MCRQRSVRGQVGRKEASGGGGAGRGGAGRGGGGGGGEGQRIGWPGSRASPLPESPCRHPAQQRSPPRPGVHGGDANSLEHAAARAEPGGVDPASSGSGSSGTQLRCACRHRRYTARAPASALGCSTQQRLTRLVDALVEEAALAGAGFAWGQSQPRRTWMRSGRPPPQRRTDDDEFEEVVCCQRRSAGAHRTPRQARCPRPCWDCDSKLDGDARWSWW